MDILLTTLVFFIFLVISFYLDVIKMSIPLVIIYFIYCFTYVINMDENSIDDSAFLNYDGNELSKSSLSITEKTFDNSRQNINKETNAPKPIVSYTPKPIKIDSNIIIKNDDVEKKSQSNINSSIDSINKTIVDEKDPISVSNTLTLNEIMICRGIYKRNPIKPGYEFLNNVDSLFCYTKISNTGPKQEIKHVWYFEDKEISSVVYNIKTSYNYRSWSRKTIYPKQIGSWKVEVIGLDGDVIGTRKFSVKSINNSY